MSIRSGFMIAVMATTFGTMPAHGQENRTAAADEIAWGDDSSQWANDGECDDPRFRGPGAAATLLDEDLGRDASDCRWLFERGRLDYIGVAEDRPDVDSSSIDWGDDSSQWANDGECDDPRFEGPGAASILLETDRMHDATDCRQLFDQGRIWHKSETAIAWGDDSSQWANDGECDDPRFEGSGAASILLDEDLMRDATDCRALYEAGEIRLKTAAGIAWGDDSSQWAHDGECDDPRFEGPGAASILLDEDLMRDASDCRELYEAGRIQLKSGAEGSGLI